MAELFFIGVHENETDEAVAAKVGLLYRKAGFASCCGQNDKTGIKMHFGEKGNDTHIRWQWVVPVVRALEAQGAKPFLMDTCVLYKSQRDNAVDHLKIAYRHGFTIEHVGAPVLIADGLLGNSEREVPVNGTLFKTVSIASMAVEANALIFLSHVTGHLGTGMGAALKNAGMGCASRKGKLKQHSTMKPVIQGKACTGCRLCMEWCPAGAIFMPEETAVIDQKKCIGCGECLTVCRYGAVKHDWRVEKNDLQKHIAEYTLGAVKGKSGRVGFMNFLLSMTKDCDCFGPAQKPILPDIGILAGFDPVAIDAATLDLIVEKTGKDLAKESYPEIDPWVQIRHGEEIGLGTASYTLNRLDGSDD